MSGVEIGFALLGSLAIGILFGGWAADRRWREKATSGLRMASGGRLFIVREDRFITAPLPPRTEAYRNGWLAQADSWQEHDNPYGSLRQQFSHAEWQRGHLDRANTAPGAYLESVQDADILKGD